MLKLGSIVKLKVPCLGNPAGSVGVCYEEYGDGGDRSSFRMGIMTDFLEMSRHHFYMKLGFPQKYRFINLKT